MSQGPNGWIGVDLDGTLAFYDTWVAWDVIGMPIKPMVDRIRKWLDEGKEVRIFTARVAFEKDKCYVTGATFDRKMVKDVIHNWLEEQAGLPRLKLTHEKDFNMIELWDDRCIQIIKNTGRTLAEEHEAEIQALKGAP